MDARTLTIIAGLVTALAGGFAKLVMWCVDKWLQDRAADRKDRREDREQDREATKTVATALTTMALKFDGFEKKLTDVKDGVQWAVDEITDNYTIPPAPPEAAPPAPAPLRRTPPKGYRVVRPKTEAG